MKPEKYMDLMQHLKNHEDEALRLRAEYVDDPSIRALIDFDLAVRRMAGRVLSLTGLASQHRPETQ